MILCKATVPAQRARRRERSALMVHAGLIMSVLAGDVPSVRAELRSPALHWTRAPNASDCVDPRTLAELVEAYTGPVLVGAGNAELSIEGQIERTDEHQLHVQLSVTVQRGRPRGSRELTLQADDCRELDGAIAFVIATTIDPELGGRALPPEMSWLQPTEIPVEDQLRAELTVSPPRAPVAAVTLAAKVGEPPAPATAAPAPTTHRPMRPAAAYDRWELGLMASYGTQTVAGPSMGGVVSVARGLTEWLTLGAQLRGHFGLTALEIDPWHSVNGQTLAVAALGCARSSTRVAFGAQLCLGPELGWLWVASDGFEQEQTVVRNSYGGVARVELRYALGRSLWLSASGLFALELGRKDVEYRVDTNGSSGTFMPAFDDEPYSVHAALGVVHAF